MYEVALSIVVLLFRAWLAMLAIGVVHADVAPEVPAFGYWQTMLFCALASWLVGPGLADIRAARED